TETSPATTPATSLVAPRVLIADDDPSVLKFLADHCAQLGFRVQTASNGLHAFAIAHRFAPDVLIIDVNMPEVNGMSLCERLLAPGKKPIDLVVIRESHSRDDRTLRGLRRELRAQGAGALEHHPVGAD
ncbi:MAG: response regulator, partial [Xanthobacteraceae bacterium]